MDLYREGMRGFGRAYMCPCSFHSVFYNGTSNIATVFVEVRLVDVGIAEENPEPVNDPVGVVWTVDQMYFMTCRKIW